MPLTKFNEWVEEKNLLKEAMDNPLLTMQQEEGDKVYFGIHDLDRYYKIHNTIPPLEFADIMDKTGEVSEVDPVDCKVSVVVDKDPYHFGYHNLESKFQRDRRKKKGEKAILKIASDCLIDVSHLIDGEHKVWLMVDSKTKYQSALMKQIRRKEMRSYMDKETADGIYHLDDSGNELDLGFESGYEFKNREVEPFFRFNPTFDPSVQKNESSWKYHLDTKNYNYYPE